MTVNAGYPIQSFPGTGSAHRFETTVDAERADDLFIEVVKTSDGSRTKLTLNVDYIIIEHVSFWAIELLDTGSRDYLTGGDTTNANLATGYRIEIRRVVKIDQQVDITNQGTFFPQLHEQTFDKLTQISQQQQHELDSAIKVVDEDGTPAGGTVTPAPDSLIVFDKDKKLKLIPHDEEVITGEKVEENKGLIDGIRDDLGEKPEDFTGTVYEAVEKNTEGVSALIEETGKFERKTTSTLEDFEEALKQGTAIFTLRLYYVSNNEEDLVAFTVRPLNAFSIAPSLFGTGALQYQEETNRDAAAPSEVFTYESVNILRGFLSDGDHLQAIDVEFHAHKITEDNYATHNLPQSFVGGIRGIPFNWSPVSIRVTDQDFHGGGGPSITFIRETVVDPAVHIHDLDEAAHPAIQARLDDLEARPTGGGSVTMVNRRGLRVIAVNDGLPVFERINEVPDSITLTVQTDVAIHAPVTVRLRGQETQAGTAVTIGTGGGTAISPGVTERVTFPISTAQKNLIESAAQAHSGTADMAIFGAATRGGAATRQATFAIYIKNSLSSMIGPINRNEILVNGLPGVLPNIITTVLANMRRSYSHIYLQGTDALAGPTKSSVTFTTSADVATHPLVLTQADWDLFLRGAYLRIYVAPGDRVATVNQAALSSSYHFDFHYGPFINLGSSDTDADGNVQAIGSIDGDVISAEYTETTRNVARVVEMHLLTVPATRTINITSELLGGAGEVLYDNLLGVELFTPSYSFGGPPVRTLAGIDSVARNSIDPGTLRSAPFSARPTGSWPYIRTGIFTSTLPGITSTPGSVTAIPVLTIGGQNYHLFGWVFEGAGEYRITGTMSAESRNQNLGLALIRYNGGTGTGDGRLTSTGATGSNVVIDVDVTATFAVGDMVVAHWPSSSRAFGSVTLNLNIQQQAALPGYTAP